MSYFAIALAALNALSQNQTQHKQLQAQITANNKTARGYMQQMNYSFQNYEQQRQDAFASAIDSLTKNRMQAHEQEATVSAAINEDQMAGGRTSNLINRSVKGDESRMASSIIGNYNTKSDEIDLNKESVLTSTKNAINSIGSVETPSYFSTILNTATNYLNTYNTLQNIGSRRSKANIGTVQTGNTAQGTDNGMPVRGVDIGNEVRKEDYGVSDSGDTARGVDLDAASVKYDTNASGASSSFSLFSSNSIFNSNPSYSYYSGDNLTNELNTTYGSYKGGSNKWQTKSLLL